MPAPGSSGPEQEASNGDSPTGHPSMGRAGHMTLGIYKCIKLKWWVGHVQFGCAMGMTRGKVFRILSPDRGFPIGLAEETLDGAPDSIQGRPY
jgi:hypothetical protein